MTTTLINKQYIEYRNQGYWIIETRISLDSVVYAYLNGASPEEIVNSFPLLNLEQVYGAITFYLGNQSLIDAYLQEGVSQFENLRESLRQQNYNLYQKLIAAQNK